MPYITSAAPPPYSRYGCGKNTEIMRRHAVIACAIPRSCQPVSKVASDLRSHADFGDDLSESSSNEMENDENASEAHESASTMKRIIVRMTNIEPPVP